MEKEEDSDINELRERERERERQKKKKERRSYSEKQLRLERGERERERERDFEDGRRWLDNEKEMTWLFPSERRVRDSFQTERVSELCKCVESGDFT